ncbi:hypothetical protein [Kangiella shandongensis]|uniref:hypothetical protein n=1 Tax=Kangiella shandongensis TaxID=2763258 RepID=UPI001CC172AB|nr:hypothetical protein [Kangiella shandongensis]
MESTEYTDITAALKQDTYRQKLLISDKAKTVIDKLPNISRNILSNQLSVIAKKSVSWIRPYTFIIKLHNSVLLLTALKDAKINATKIQSAENLSISKQYPMGMSPKDAKKLDDCIADTHCIGINYTRSDNHKNINYIFSKRNSLIFHEIDNFNHEEWKTQETLFGQGSVADFSAGNQIIIGIKGSASPLPTQASPVQVDSYPYDRKNKQLIKTKPKHNPSQGYIAPLTGALKDEEFYLFKAAILHLYGQRWIVEIPRHESAHGNTQGYTVRILVKKNDKK